MTEPGSGPWVVGLDLSLTSTGCAHTDGTVDVFATRALRGMARVDVIVNRVTDMCSSWRHPADLAVIEGYSMGSKGRAVLDLAELGGIVRYRLWCAGVRYLDVPPPTLKIFATGNGTADKTAMVVAARERLAYAGTQADEADALWLRALGYQLLDAPLIRLPKTHLRALDKLTLPDPLETPPWPRPESTAAANGMTSNPGNGP